MNDTLPQWNGVPRRLSPHCFRMYAGNQQFADPKPKRQYAASCSMTEVHHAHGSACGLGNRLLKRDGHHSMLYMHRLGLGSDKSSLLSVEAVSRCKAPKASCCAVLVLQMRLAL